MSILHILLSLVFTLPPVGDSGARAPRLGFEMPQDGLAGPFAPVPPRDFERIHNPSTPVVVPFDAPGKGTGGLTGKHVYVSQGHGWTWSDVLGRWATQRGNTWGIVEDFVNAEGINQYLLRYLENAGATVWPVRERDLRREMVIVDDGDGDGAPNNGVYEEIGGGFQHSSAAGFGNFLAPYEGTENPMTLGGSRYHTTGDGEGDSVRWTPNLPARGEWTVSVSWAASDNRTTDAHYVVRHPGGAAHFRVDQTGHGNTWIYLGTFLFEGGTNPQTGSVELHTDTADGPGVTVISVDAVRFGGGEGVIVRGDGTGLTDGPTSGRPRWEENCRCAAQFNGAPPTVYDASSSDGNDDVGARSRYAAWQHEEGEDAVYISWHTNAPDGGTGTSTYLYGPNEPDGQYIFTGTEGSDVLGQLIHAEIVNDIRGAYDPAWTDRGLRTAWFGELNPSHNPEMPAALVEVAFHATESDALKIQDPKFRNIVSRAFYQGVVRYFAQKDGLTPVFLPEPPAGFRVQADGPGAARLTWRPSPTDEAGVLGHPASGYVVYTGRWGAWDGGVDVGDSLETTVEGLEPGAVHEFRVAAYNAGGHSFATPTLALWGGEAGAAAALVVGGFDRLDRHALLTENLSPWDLAVVLRMDLDRMNTYGYVPAHGRALAALGLPFDSAWHDAALDADALAAYPLVDWLLGEESTEDETFSFQEAMVLFDYRGQGGALLVTGAEVGWDLVELGSVDEQAFFTGVLHGTYLGDDAATYDLALADGTPLNLDDGSLGTYDVDYPDLVGTNGYSQEVAFYDGDPTRPAAVAYEDPAGGGVALAGVPLEAIYPEPAREALLAALLDGMGFTHPWEIPVDPAEPSPEEPEADVVSGDTATGDDLPGSDTPGTPDGGGPACATKSCRCTGTCPCSSGCAASPVPHSGFPLLLLLLILLSLRGLSVLRDRHWVGPLA
ncbi:MAG: N-acetylmuramoyl-L-alanine amidase [Pseudomonadota bacterium]